MARLLHGMTDALTPQNILYNSDFYQGGGALASNTVTGSFTYNSNNCVFAEGWRINPVGSNMTVSYTRELNKLHVEVTGTYTGNDGLRITHKLGIQQQLYENIYTYTCKISNLQIQNCELRDILFYMVNAYTSSTYYSHNEYIADNTFIHTEIRKDKTYDSSSTSSFAVRLRVQNVTGIPKISFDISDIAVYEGAFTNPPTPKNRLHYNDYALEPVINPIKYIAIGPTSSGWKTVCSICQGNHVAYNCLFSLDRQFNSSNGYDYFLGGVSLYVIPNAAGGLDAGSVKFYQLAASKIGTGYFTKLRITYKKEFDNRVWFYLEVYVTGSTMNAIRFHIISTTSEQEKLITEYQRLGASSATAPTDRTLLVSEFTITYS